MTYSLSNIKEGKQPASLFSIPAGYKKITMQMPGMGMGGMGMGKGKGMPGMGGMGKGMPGMGGMGHGKGMGPMPAPGK